MNVVTIPGSTSLTSWQVRHTRCTCSDLAAEWYVGGPVGVVGVPDQAELLEQLEGPVDGGHVHRLGLLAYGAQHLVGHDMAQPVHGPEHQLCCGVNR